jgi:prepilin signal peptidase PulO-like enzyme (type II secretory pathway)
MILAAFLFFVFGTIVGSFLNVVIFRYNTGRSLVSGRSSCPVCRHELAWYELVPLFSFLFLKGRCAKCHAKISWQYPLVELLTGLTFAAIYLRYSLSLPLTSYSLLFDLIIFSLLIVILVYDFKHKIIPDGLVYTFILLSFLKLLLLSPHLATRSLSELSDLVAGPSELSNLVAGPIMFLPFFLLWFISKGRWMGFGDAKLAAGIGWFLGLIGAISAIVLAFWIGAVVGFLLLWLFKRLTIKSEIPFAPFLILGVFLVYFFQIDVTGLSTLLIVR